MICFRELSRSEKEKMTFRERKADREGKRERGREREIGRERERKDNQLRATYE
jgi:hypothetical protein